MPLYEYKCTTCHHLTEKIQKYSDADQTICPSCGGPLERTITAASMSFKGGGWFKDGYSSVKPSAPSGGGDSSAAGGDSSAAMVSSDSGSAGASSAGPGTGSDSGSGKSAQSGHSAKPEAAPSTSPAPALAAATRA